MPALFPQTFASEFPDYPIISLPDLEGWEDTSLRNDPCPSFRRNDLLVWIDYPDPREREDFDGCRFILCRLDKKGQLPAEDSTLLETDNWTEIVALVN